MIFFFDFTKHYDSRAMERNNAVDFNLFVNVNEVVIKLNLKQLFKGYQDKFVEKIYSYSEKGI